MRLRVAGQGMSLSHDRPVKPTDGKDEGQNHDSQKGQDEHSAASVCVMRFAVHLSALMELLHIPRQLFPQCF